VGRTLLLVPSHHGVMGASLLLPREPKRVRLVCMAGRQAWPPLAVRVMLGVRGSEPSTSLGMPHTIPDMVHERSSPHFLSGMSSGAPGTSPFTTFHK
jgi:hypothetical protein